MYEGSCLCGRVRYVITCELPDYGCCHCESCRKASGTAYGANVGIDREHFQLQDPEGLVKEYQSSPDKVRAFCSNCGSQLFACRNGSNAVRVRLGTLDTPFSKPPTAHGFVGEKAPWEPLHDDIPKFDGWIPKAVLVQKGSKQP